MAGERLEELVAEADRMGDVLGHDHDLVVSRLMLTVGPGEKPRRWRAG